MRNTPKNLKVSTRSLTKTQWQWNKERFQFTKENTLWEFVSNWKLDSLLLSTLTDAQLLIDAEKIDLVSFWFIRCLKQWFNQINLTILNYFWLFKILKIFKLLFQQFQWTNHSLPSNRTPWVFLQLVQLSQQVWSRCTIKLLPSLSPSSTISLVVSHQQTFKLFSILMVLKAKYNWSLSLLAIAQLKVCAPSLKLLSSSNRQLKWGWLLKSCVSSLCLTLYIKWGWCLSTQLSTKESFLKLTLRRMLIRRQIKVSKVLLSEFLHWGILKV